MPKAVWLRSLLPICTCIFDSVLVKQTSINGSIMCHFDKYCLEAVWSAGIGYKIREFVSR